MTWFRKICLKVLCAMFGHPSSLLVWEEERQHRIERTINVCKTNNPDVVEITVSCICERKMVDPMKGLFGFDIYGPRNRRGKAN